MEVRKGYVEHIVFRNNDNGYTVFQLVSEEEELTCVGLFSVLAEGELVQVSKVSGKLVRTQNPFVNVHKLQNAGIWEEV